jgi:hypothetical protein
MKENKDYKPERVQVFDIPKIAEPVVEDETEQPEDNE